MRYATAAAVACSVLFAAPAPGSAQSAWFDLSVPGSIGEILGRAAPALEGPYLLRRLIDTFHDPTGTIINPAQAAGAFRDCLGDVQRLRDRWRAVEQAAGQVSLSAAGSRDGRRTLQRFLELFDLALAGESGDLRVVPNRAETSRREAEEVAEPAVCGVGAGWGSAEIERRLNAGETVVWDVPHFEVSLPLSPQLWLQVFYRDDPGDQADELAAELAADLVGRLAADSRAARLYAGLAALDDTTLAWLGTQPRLQRRLAGDHLATFAQFGGGLRVRDGAVDAPGGDAAAPFWEALVGVPVTDPQRFVDRLFASERVAAAFDLVSRLPGPARRFVTNNGEPESRDWRRGIGLLGRVIERLPPPDPRFAERDAVPSPRPTFRDRLDELLAGSAPHTGDRLNENICNLPHDEATILTWRIPEPYPTGPPSWMACGPFECSGGHASEMAAIERVFSQGEPEYVCQVETRLQLTLDSLRPVRGFGDVQWSGRLYRLGIRQTGATADPRQFITR